MRLILENPSPVRASRWISIPAPSELVGDLDEVPIGMVGRAGPFGVVRGAFIDDRTWLHARLHPALSPSLWMEPGSTHAHRLYWKTPLPALSDNWWESPLTFTLLVKRILGGESASWTFDTDGMEVLRRDPVRVVRHGRGFPGGQLVADLWVTRWRDQEIAEWELLITASSGHVGTMFEELEEVVLEADAPLWADGLRSRSGQVLEPTRLQIAPACRIYDGQSLAAFGRVAVLPTWPGWTQVQAILAELRYPLTGMVDSWEKGFGPMGHRFGVGADEAETLRAYVVRRCGELSLAMDAPQKTPWGAVPYGLSKRPADSGDQQAFGLAKCAEAVALNEPLFLIPARYCATYSLACRPVLHREPSGDPIKPELHRRLVLENERPHHDQSVSPDRLGKEEEFDPELTEGWEGMDSQHYSPLFEVAAYVLTGSPMLGFMLDAMANRFLLTLTLPSTHPHHNRSTNDMGAARAIGRMHQAADWLSWALGRHDLLQLIAARTDECIAPQWTGKDVEEGLVRPLRMEVHDHMPGKCGWRPPFEAMGLMGLAIAYRAGSRAAYTVGHAVVRSLLKYGLEASILVLEPLWGVHWFEEAPGVYPSDPSLFQIGGGRWGEWAAGFLLRWAELERALGEEEIYQSILEVVRAAGRRYGTPAPNDVDPCRTRLRHLEWIGLVPAIAAPVAE